ncbi:MAG: hypothetical protein ACRDM7_22915 [Thermoleophilaceae bacterium]
MLQERPPKLVYLDLNHWVEFSKAMAGHPGGEPFRPALDACIDALGRHAALFPLSDAIYMEVSRMASFRQRRDLADVMQALSRFVVITSRSLIADHEVEALLDRVVGPRPDPKVAPLAYLAWGVARAFGKMGGWRVRNKDTGEDMTDWARSAHPRGSEWWDATLADAEVRLNRQVIEGPSNAEDEADLKRHGYNPFVAYEHATRRAQQEIAQAARLAAEPEWRRGRIRDVIATHEVIVELLDKFTRGLIARGKGSESVFADDAAAREGFVQMPSFDVAVTMKAAYHRDPNHRWTPNDVFDIDALGSTLPYCDIVVTDKAAASHARRTGLADRCGATVLSRVEDLLGLL